MKRILLAEDEAMLREAIAEVLRFNGYEVIEAEDGSRALVLARLHSPDLVLSDVRMTPMTGTEFLTALREDAALAATPFILMTGATDRTPMRQGMRLGADDYLAKPFLLSDMLEAVETRLRKHEQARAQAESRVAELRANLSMSLPHELLTPLTCILGYSDMILTGYDSLQPNQILEMVSDIQKCGNRLLRLSQNYLFYASLQLLSQDSCRLLAFKGRRLETSRAVVRTAAENAAGKYSRTLDFTLDWLEQPAPLNEDHLAKVIEELVDNACKFSDPGTPVRVTNSRNPAEFHFEVCDHGRGMRPEQVAQIGAYQQFDRRVHEQQGTGLGLAIAKKLVELYGGTLQVDSQPGVGTTVRVLLPMAG